MEQATPSIQDKIRAAAVAQGIDPDLALRIANAESTLSNTAKNTQSSARGLFQIIDSTWKNFGGDPKLRNDVDENIRVGLKIIGSNRDAYLKKYGVEPSNDKMYGMHVLGQGDAFRVFNAKEDAAIKNIVPQKVIKSNPYMEKMSVADFINFTQNRMNKKGPVAPSATAVAKTEGPVPMPQTPKETMQQSPTKVTSPRTADLPKTVSSAPMDRNMLEELGANYQAALGAISLADSAEDEEEDELLVEKYAERFGDQTMDLPVPNALADVNLSYTSPFEEPAPVQMSKGGDPSIPFPTDMSFDDIPEMPPNPTPEQEAEFLKKVEEMDARAYWKRRGPNSADELNYSPSRKMMDELYSSMGTEIPSSRDNTRMPIPTDDQMEQRKRDRYYANGGAVGVQKMAFGGIPYKPSAMISSAVKNQVSSAQAALDAYNRDVGSYNDQLNEYNTQAENYRRQVEDYNNQVNSYNDQRNQYYSSFIGGENPVLFTQARGFYNPISGRGVKAFSTKTPNLTLVSQGKAGPNPQYFIRQGDYRDIGEPSAPGDAPTFSVSAPNAPTAPTQTVESANAAVAAAKEKQRRLQLTYDVMEDPEKFNLSMPALFAEGGPVHRANGSPYEGEKIEATFGDRMGANISDFIAEKLIKLRGMSSDREKLPASHRIFLDTFADENRDPITNKNFNKEELDAFRNVIEHQQKTSGKKGSGAIQYKDYIEYLRGNFVLPKESEKVDLNDPAIPPALKSFLLSKQPSKIIGGKVDPYFSARSSLGQFQYKLNPKTNSYDIVNEAYDFNPLPKPKGLEKVDISSDALYGDYVSDTLFSPYDMARIYAGRKLPPGTGRPVSVSVPRKRAEGSPIYGEIPDSGPITADTRAAMSNFQVPNAREAMDALKKIYGEGAANMESRVRGTLAAIPGSFGDIGQDFDIRGLRELPTTEQLLKKYPQRLTQPTAEDEGFTKLGTFMPFGVSPSAVTGTAKTLMNSFKKAAPTGPTTDQRLRALFGGVDYITPTSNVVQATPQAAKAVQAAAPATRTADQLFVGRIDEFLASQKNPVTKEQLIGQLKGKFRDYEIARVEEALADLPAASKLQPADLLARVKSKYPVDNFRTSIIEPKPGVQYNDVDNVYKKDVGIINLTLPVADATRKAADDAMLTLNSLNNFGNGRFDPPQIGQITTYLKENGLSSNYKELLNAFKVVENSPEIKKLAAAKETLLNVGRAVSSPNLHPKEPEVMAKLQKKYPNTSLVKLLPMRDAEIAKIGLKELTHLVSNPQFKPLQYVVNGLERVINSEKDVKKSDIIGKINVEVSLLDQQSKPVIDRIISTSAKDEYVKLGNELQKKRIYEGQHPSITVKENPVAFSRFVDKEAAIPGMGNTKVMHIIELQSDLFDDIVKKGSKARSKEKDLAEIVNLDKKAFQIEHSGPFQKEAVDKLKTISSKHYPRPAEKSEAYKEILGRYPDLKTQLIDYIKLTDRSSKLKARAAIGNYNRDEAFAGMEKSPQVLQQLMIKNSIGAAMQRGVNAITFPGKESEQAQLYEKLGPNLKQVVKDLGKGFEIRPIEMYDDLGNAYMHEGLVWSKDTAARVLKEGIKFNKGGAVDKNNLDYAKYI